MVMLALIVVCEVPSELVMLLPNKSLCGSGFMFSLSPIIYGFYLLEVHFIWFRVRLVQWELAFIFEIIYMFR